MSAADIFILIACLAGFALSALYLVSGYIQSRQ
jgi:hypothetical protein